MDSTRDAVEEEKAAASRKTSTTGGASGSKQSTRVRRTTAYRQAVSRTNKANQTQGWQAPTEITFQDQEAARAINRKLQEERERTPLVEPDPVVELEQFQRRSRQPFSSSVSATSCSSGGRGQVDLEEEGDQETPLEMLWSFLQTWKACTQAAYARDAKGKWNEESAEMKSLHLLEYPPKALRLIQRHPVSKTELESMLPAIVKARGALLGMKSKADRTAGAGFVVPEEEQAKEKVEGQAVKKKNKKKTLVSLVVNGEPRRLIPGTPLPDTSDIEDYLLLILRTPLADYLVTTIIGGVHPNFIAVLPVPFSGKPHRLDRSQYFFSENFASFSNEAKRSGNVKVCAGMWSRECGVQVGPELDLVYEQRNKDGQLVPVGDASLSSKSGEGNDKTLKQVIPNKSLLKVFETSNDIYAQTLAILEHNKVAANALKPKMKRKTRKGINAPVARKGGLADKVVSKQSSKVTASSVSESENGHARKRRKKQQ
eukprot:GSA25T00000438001.1